MIKAGFPMKLWFSRCAPALLFLAVSTVALPQRGGGGRPAGPQDEPDARMPDGKSQKDEILKAEHQQNLKDAAELASLAEQLKADLEKDDRYILSVATLKKTDEIEKLVKKIRARLRH
jgi:hypothetical protein